MRRRERPMYVSLREYTDALRAADQRALQIKETADEKALELDREIRAYKDEKANNLRDQINTERGLYATKEDLRSFGRQLFTSTVAIVTIVVAIGSIAVAIALHH